MRRGGDVTSLIPEGCEMCGEAAEEYCGVEEEEGECVSGDEYPSYCTKCDDFDHSVCPEDDKCCCSLCDDMEEEEPTDCTDCVSQDDYERLYRMVEAQAEQIAALESQMMDVAGLEATVNDVDTQLTNLATCLSYDSSYEPEPEPETMEPTKSPTSLLNVLSIGMVCPNEGGYRTFKNKDHETPEACYYACEAHERCEYFSYRESNFDCIGCSIVPNTSNGFTEEYVTYAVNMGSRRQLSELELLRAENAALKEALSQARRN